MQNHNKTVSLTLAVYLQLSTREPCRRCCHRSALGPDRKPSPPQVGGAHSTALCHRDTPSHSLAGVDRGDTPTSDTPPRSGDSHSRVSCSECTGLNSGSIHSTHTHTHSTMYTHNTQYRVGLYTQMYIHTLQYSVHMHIRTYIQCNLQNITIVK